MEKIALAENSKRRLLLSENYNYLFNKENGFFMRWGKTREDDPLYSEVGPEIADIEISTVCKKACKWCYKSNTAKGINMDFETFKKVFHNLPKNVMQIAFGIGDIKGNPDLWNIMQYTRDNGVIPNITVNGDINQEQARRLAEVCGAVAVSHYSTKCYTAVKMLTQDLDQVNIHKLLAEETYESCFRLIADVGVDPRLKKLNAIVFLTLKPKGNRNNYHVLKDKEKYKKLIDYAIKKGVGFGFDSCSAPKFLEAVKDSDLFEKYSQLAESCESTRFSIYINAEGKVYPCSFMEDELGWENGIDMLNVNNFIDDVWNNEKFIKFRTSLLNNCNKDLAEDCFKCPHYELY